MKTIQFRFAPDDTLPVFRRLDWDIVDVTFLEILEHGIHPWTGDNLHQDLADAFVDRLNRDVHKPAGLREHQMMQDAQVVPVSQWSAKTRFELVLDRIQKYVLFCEANLDFAALAEIARRKLTEEWRSGLALKLAERLCPNFQELRRFLKSKERKVKLSGHADLGDYDWSRILSLEDFANHERLLIEEAVRPLNLRNVSFLDAVTDEHGRLRLVDSIDHVALTQPATAENTVPLLWQAERQGHRWRLRPNVGASRTARLAAREFASRWRRDDGKLCFYAGTQDLTNIVESGSAIATFLGLRYTQAPRTARVAANVSKDKVPLYVLGGFPSQSWSAERLKSILRDYGTSTTGTKKVLVEKIAKLAESEYHSHELLLHGFFAENRFVRVSRDVRYGEAFPLLGNEYRLKGLVLHLYALRHLRANAVIDPSHENDGCTVQQLAIALIAGRLKLAGGFVRVA